MDSIQYINRQNGQIEKEEVFGESAIRFLYGSSFFSKIIGRLSLHSVAKWPLFSACYGWLQNRPKSKRRVMPFIKRFGIDTTEFLESPNEYCTFNDFFIRRLKPEARPINAKPAIIPADGRYLFYQDVSSAQAFQVKSRPFCLKTIFQDETLASRYEGGSVVIARLCPTDCHRFYFPIDSVPSKARCINGLLYSVNPIAIKDNPWIWGTNRRMLTILSSDAFDDVAFIEVGATNVGTIIETYSPGKFQQKGAEKGYFSFGGSALLIFFKKGRIRFDQDLLDASMRGLEIKCLIGESMGSNRP